MIHFIIFSALNTPHGIFNANERLSQTIETFNSIKKKFPNTKITLLESGSAPLTSEQENAIIGYVDRIVDISTNEVLMQFYKNWTNEHICKNLCESFKFWYSTRCFIFDKNIIAILADKLKLAHYEVIKHVTTGKYCNIEHAIYKHIPSEIINSVQLGTLGVKGLLAPNGIEIKD